jgi:ATP-dependent protease HslVU peptidase subunit
MRRAGGSAPASPGGSGAPAARCGAPPVPSARHCNARARAAGVGSPARARMGSAAGSRSTERNIFTRGWGATGGFEEVVPAAAAGRAPASSANLPHTSAPHATPRAARNPTMALLRCTAPVAAAAARAATRASASLLRASPSSALSSYAGAGSGGEGGGMGGGMGFGGAPLHGNPMGWTPVTPMMPPHSFGMHATTILAVRKGGKVVRTTAGGGREGRAAPWASTEGQPRAAPAPVQRACGAHCEAGGGGRHGCRVSPLTPPARAQNGGRRRGVCRRVTAAPHARPAGGTCAARVVVKLRTPCWHRVHAGHSMLSTLVAPSPHPPPPPTPPPPPPQAVIGDGQVTRGSEVVKGNAVKVRRIGAEGHAISGFAGSTADCIALRERLETKLEEHPGQLTRACVELAKEWRTEKYLRRLEAVMLVVDKDVSLTITGNGDVIEPADGIIAIGSGGSYALAGESGGGALGGAAAAAAQ